VTCFKIIFDVNLQYFQIWLDWSQCDCHLLYSAQNFSSRTYKKLYYHIWLGQSHDTSILYYLYIFEPNNFFEFFLNFFLNFKLILRIVS
jgi:hypothetical protein